MKKVFFTSLMMLMIIALLTQISCADSSYWTCSNCGRQKNTGNFCSNCGAASPFQGSYTGYYYEQIPGEPNQVKVHIQSVSSNSYIVNHNDPTLWLPDHAADGDERTCWQFSSQSNTLGTVYLDLNVGSPETIDSIWIKNGFWSYTQSGDDLYIINSRPRRMRIEFLYEYSENDFEDALNIELVDDASRDGWQKFDIGRHNEVVSVRLWVLSAYTGSYYKNDICLSEVMLVQRKTTSSTLFPSTQYSTYNYSVQAPLLMRLSTRSGPSTRYDEPGTFFNSNWRDTIIKVLGKSWDGNIWWVLVDFNYGNTSYRVWTGLKRVNVDIDLVPEIYSTGQGTIDATETRRGPGSNYAKGPTITSWKDVVAFGRENGYIEVEYYNHVEDRIYRFWVPEKRAHIDPPSSDVSW